MCLEKFQSPLVMQWTAPATGIAMCQIPADVEGGQSLVLLTVVGHLPRRGDRLSAALRWRWRVFLAELGARGDFEPSGAVAGGGGPACFARLGGVIVTVCRSFSVAARVEGGRARRSR